MAFINEIISEEDKTRYGLDALWRKYHDVLSPKLPNKWEWTIDREREVWLMETAGIPDNSVFDHAYSSIQIWTLHVQGENIEVRIEYSDNKELNGVVYNKVWDLLSMIPDSIKTRSTQELIALLDEALKAYGYMGVIRQRENYTVALRDCRKDQ